jgi:hypothetical protein
MQQITLRVVEGADRGRVYRNLATPITIGREEGNSIQLNDERVSRFHIRIQYDQGQLVLTDLESTNGTKVNGEETHLRILRHGDVISVGRSTLLYGTREEINRRLGPLQDAGRGTPRPERPRSDNSPVVLPTHWKDNSNYQLDLLELAPPELPSRLSPAQAAQLSEVIEYIHMRLRNLINQAQGDGRGQWFQLDQRQWQYLLDIQARLSEYLRTIVHPDNANP